ncbi:MAG TPA: VWA domain-containing protein [Candidatus Saccharimonadia bacterium]|jgi:Ca-activated chloride channel family protein
MKLQPVISWWLLVPYLIAVMAAGGWQILKVRKQERRVVLRWVRRASLLLLPGLLALGPSIPGGTSSPGVANLDVIFAVDTTPSMAALDYHGTGQRLDGAKADLLALVDKMQGAHIEIITFDSNANIILPFTSDLTALSSAVQGMIPEVSSYSQGSAIDEPKDLIVQELKNSKTAFPQHKRLLYYLGDGEQTVSAAVQSFAPIAPYLNGGAVLGYGTTVGAQMLDYTGDSTQATTYIQTAGPSSQLTPAVSKMDPTTLTNFASQMQVAYQNRNAGGAVDSVYKASKAQIAVDNSQHLIRYLSLYWLLAIPFAGLVFWEWKAVVIKFLDLRQYREGAKRG